MASYQQIFAEYQALLQPNVNNALEILIQKYLKALSDKTGRNVIAYYSGFLNAPDVNGIQVNDDDKNGFMITCKGLDRTKGLDLILHTPGGDIAATESIVYYLRKMFDTDIRAIIPLSAMSAGTMIACSCKEILMGKHSNLGPIDPQFNGLPTHGVLEEFEKAKQEIKADPSLIPLWQTIISKYHPTFLGECEHALIWSKEIVCEWLESGMFKNDANKAQIAKDITEKLSDHKQTRTHARHISIDECKRIGLKINEFESDQPLQDCILDVHHAFMIALSTNNNLVKLITNQNGDLHFRAFAAR